MMKKLSVSLLLFAIMASFLVSFKSVVYAAITCIDNTVVADASKCPENADPTPTSAKECGSSADFLGFPKWYKYLQMNKSYNALTGVTVCQPVLSGLSSIWRIVAAVIEILLHVAVLAAIGFVVFGGILYTTSQGAPDKTKQALKTIISAAIGLVIAIASSALVSFVAGRF